MKFVKIHGIGNNFVCYDNTKNKNPLPTDLKSLAKSICNVNFGIGADGLILIENSEICNFKMRIINADGSEPEMCGNGIRCVVKFLVDEQLTDKKQLSIETLAGEIKTTLISRSPFIVKVDMGVPQFSSVDVKAGDTQNILISDKSFFFCQHGQSSCHHFC